MSRAHQGGNAIGKSVANAAAIAVNSQSISDNPWKKPVRAATTANITLSGTQTIDGVAVIAGDRVLVKDQTTASQNGIYVCAAGAWSRATDADGNSEVVTGLSVRVTEGTVNAKKGYFLSTTGAITVGTTALTFEGFSAAFMYRRINAQTGTTYTFVEDDGDGATMTTASNASAQTYTMPALTVGKIFPVTVIGAGQVTFVGSGGLTLQPPPGFALKSRGQYARLTIEILSASLGILSGDVSPV
jgi:phage-related tail fiber protein